MSVNPSDSVSSTGKNKKQRPGKSQRMDARLASGNTSATNAPASMSAVERFSRGAQGPPIPQPGKFPVVFPSGAGEPTRDAFIAYDGKALGSIVSSLPERYSSNSRYAEFASHAEVTSGDFETWIARSFYLGLAQQTVHSHMGMGLPQGDFGPVSTSEVSNLTSVRSILTQFGEFGQDSLGTRFLLKDYESTVRALVRAADSSANDVPSRVGKTEWLPVSRRDLRSQFVVANKLASFIEGAGVRIDVNRLSEDVFRRTSDVWNAVKPLLGVDRDRFDFLFTGFTTEQQFLDRVGVAARRPVLQEIGLDWPTPAIGDLRFGMDVKGRFSTMSDELARSRATYAKFFSMGSGLGNRSVACGSSAQLSLVSTTDSVTLVKSLLAQAAPEYSLLACFPCSALTSDLPKFNVVVTTSLNVSQRATEFSQLDWS